MERKELVTLIDTLVKEFNDYSELVALNYSCIKEDPNGCHGDMLDWNRGSLNKTKEHLELIAKTAGVKIIYKYGPHDFGTKDCDYYRVLEYRTAHF